MPRAKSKTDFYKSLSHLVDAVGDATAKAKASVPSARRKPGRPARVHAETCAVVLHLYKEQVRWLDGYAEFLASLTPGNAYLSRVEIVRALLMGLAEYASTHSVGFTGPTKIKSEYDLQAAVVRALKR